MFDRFDICEAYYVYATLYHSGQWSRAYRIFGRLEKIKFKPADALTCDYEDALSENGREIFDSLVSRDY